MGGINGDKQLYGMHVKSFYGDETTGMAEIYAGDFKYIKRFDSLGFQGCWTGDKYLAVFYDAETPELVTYSYYNAKTWELETTNGYTLNSQYVLPYGLTYDHTTGTIYGCFFENTSKFIASEDAKFGYITNNPFEPTNIINKEQDLPERMRALATDKDGQIWGIGMSGMLYKINKLNGATEEVMQLAIPSCDDDDNSSPFDTYGRESIAVDWETGLFYFAYGDYNGDPYVAKIDVTNGDVEVVSDFSYNCGSGTCENFTGIYFENELPRPEGVVPSPVTGLKVTSIGTTLQATVSFTLPTTDVDGNALDGTVNWRISCGQVELLSGEGTPGGKVSETVTAPMGGHMNFTVVVSKGDATSTAVSESAFVGPDTPVIYGKPSVKVKDKAVTVTWTEAYGVNYGNLDPVTYKVIRMPDNFVVSEKCTELSVVDNIESDIKTRYYYTVQPVAGEVAGEAVESRACYVGKYLGMPFSEDFDDNDRFLTYDVIDSNKDNNIWDINLSRSAAYYHGNQNEADDYLLIDPFDMKAGRLYTFHMVADGHNQSEIVAVYTAVKNNDNYDLTEFIPNTKVDPMVGEASFNKQFVPETDGDSYFAIKACSQPYSSYLYIYEVSVTEIGGENPAAPVDVDVVPGANSATVNFTMPERNVDGSAATGLTEARIYRDGKIIGTLTEGVSAGAKLAFTDEEAISDGIYRYAVSAVNAAGEGPTTEVSCYRGLDYPGTPRNLRFWEDLETPGLIHISFDAPERGYNGGYIDPAGINYILDYLVMGGPAGDINLGAGTTHTFQLPMDVKVQDVFAGSIYGNNARGNIKTSWKTNVCTIGPALALPVQESWSGMSQKSGIWIGQRLDDDEGSYESWWDIHDGSQLDAQAQDNNGGLYALSNAVDGSGHRVLAPRVALKDAKNPTLVFYYYYTSAATEFNLEILEEDQPVRVLRNLDLSSDNADRWIRCEVPLNDYTSKQYIQLAFSGRGNVANGYIAIDNVSILDYTANDLAVKDFTAPVRCDINVPVSFGLTIRNNGGQEAKADSWSVRLYKNGEMVSEQPGTTMPAATEIKMTLSDIPSVTDPAASEYYAEIVFDADENKADNVTKHAIIRVITPEYPGVTDLGGTADNEVVLTWSDPSTADMPGTPVIESFESYEPFIINNIGDWTLYDQDKKNTVILALETGILDYPNIGSPMAWQVFDPSKANIPFDAWVPRTGKNILVSFQACIDNHRDVDSEDWLVSPELNGSEQTISIYARTAMRLYSPEIFDFMISSSGNAIEDFVALESDVAVQYTSGLEWTEFRYKVPAGTRYFAIVHKTREQMVMLVDDITYIPAGSQPLNLELQGFNVYRDGKRLNEEPVTENEYVDSNVEINKSYTYHVTTVWDRGESPLSNEFTVKVSSGVGSIEGYDITVRSIDGGISVEGGRGETVHVFSLSGSTVACETANGQLFIPVPAKGLYLVKVGNTVEKIIVR